MELELIYATKEEIPAGFESLYTEKDGKFHLTGVKGLTNATQSTEALRRSLTAAREDVKKLTKKVTDLETERNTLTTERDELKILVDTNGDPDDNKVAKLVKDAKAAAAAPLQRQLDAVNSQLAQAQKELADAQTREKRSKINDAIAKAGTAAKVVPSAIEDMQAIAERVFDVDEDGNVVTRDGVGVTPGIDAVGWISEMKPKREHWFPPSTGGGAGGAGLNGAGGKGNPFTYENWNVTEQSKLSEADFNRLAAAAGVNPKRPVRPAPKK